MPSNAAPRLPKTTRFDEASTKPSNERDLTKQQFKSPTAAAKNIITCIAEPLQPSIQTLVLLKANCFLKLKTNAFTKSNRLLKLETPEYIPNSCRIKFQLVSKSDIKDSPEFLSLASETKLEVAAFETKLKSLISATVALELNLLTENLKTLATELLVDLTELCLLEDAHSYSRKDLLDILIYCLDDCPGILDHVDLTPTSAIQLVSTFLDKRMDTATFMEPSSPEPAPPERTSTALVIRNPYSKSPSPTQTSLPTTQDSPSKRRRPNSDTPSSPPDVDRFGKTVDTLIDLLYHSLTSPWSKFLSVHKTNQVAIRLSKYTKTETTLPATDAASSLLQEEAPTTPATIDKLIDSKVNEKLRRYSSQVNHLQQKLHRSSQPRGRPTTRNPRNNQQTDRNRSRSTSSHSVSSRSHHSTHRQSSKSKNSQTGDSRRRPSNKNTFPRRSTADKNNHGASDNASSGGNGKHKQSAQKNQRRNNATRGRSNSRSQKSTRASS